jgi:ligand-binding sensor domain-containing protein/signal transduction histidine kinase
LTRYAAGSILHFSSKDGLPSDDVTALCEDRQGALWIGTSRGIATMRNGRIETHPSTKALTHPFISSLISDDEGILWIGTKGGGLSRLSKENLQTYTAVDGLNRNFVSSLSQDREGNIWIGTERGGLNMLRKTKISTYTTRDGLRNDYVRSVYEDRKGTVWVGTNGGGLSFLKDGKFATLPLKEVLPNDFVRPLFEDRSGNLWIGTWGGGIVLLKNGNVTRPVFLRDFPGRYIRAIVEDRNGNMWVAANGQGAYKYSNGRWTLFDTQNGLSNVFVSSIAEDTTGTMWIGTSGGGLNRLRHDSVTSFRMGKGLTSDFVSSLHIDTEGTLWIGTNGGGLCRLQSDHFTSWTAAAGLADEFIEAIVDDHRGNLWLTGPRGISRVSKRELEEHARGSIQRLHPVSFDESDGMRSSECTGGSQNAGARSKDGRIWIPTVEGLVVIDPQTINKESLRFPLYVERLAIDKAPMEVGAPIIANYGNGEIEVQYSAVTFRNATKVQFRYRLEGFEEAWQDARSRRTAFYTNVPPGKFVFHVEADAGAGSIPPLHASIAFTILPPFWMTGWFRGLMGLAAVGLVVGTVRYFSMQKLKRKLQAAESQATLERERLRISKDMHDELGASLTKITLLGELAKRDVADPGKMEEHLDLIANASREVAGTMDEIVWAVNPRNDTLDCLAAYFIDYAKEYLSITSLQLQIDTPEDLPARTVSAEIRHNVFLVFKEALTNIVKHAAAGRVRITLQYHDPLMTITLEDDGRGFSTASAGRFSNGLDNMRKRIESSGGTFTVESEPQRGTKLCVTIEV